MSQSLEWREKGRRVIDQCAGQSKLQSRVRRRRDEDSSHVGKSVCLRLSLTDLQHRMREKISSPVPMFQFQQVIEEWSLEDW